MNIPYDSLLDGVASSMCDGCGNKTSAFEGQPTQEKRVRDQLDGRQYKTPQEGVLREIVSGELVGQMPHRPDQPQPGDPFDHNEPLGE